MTLERAEEIWAAQTTPKRDSAELRRMIDQHRRASRAASASSLGAILTMVFLCALNFYGSYVIHQEGLLLASLRVSVLVVVIPIQIQSWRSMLREGERRRGSGTDQRTWIGLMMSDTAQKIRELTLSRLSGCLVLVLSIVSLTKWIDFRQGGDTAGECIAIVIAVALVMSVAIVFAVHYREQFLKPRLRRYVRIQQSLTEMDGQPA